MTDTQEAMRADFEAATTVPYGVAFIHGRYQAKEGSGEGHWVSAKAYQHDYEIWQAATAQSAEKIARLEADVAHYKQINHVQLQGWTQDHKRAAAAELSNKQLQARLEESDSCLCDLGEGKGGWAWEEVHDSNQEALAQQPSTEALAEYVAKLIPPGWKIVPIEPSQRMIEHANTAAKAANISISGRFESAEAIERVLLRSAYIAMLDAAPLPPAPDKE